MSSTSETLKSGHLFGRQQEPPRPEPTKQNKDAPPRGHQGTQLNVKQEKMHRVFLQPSIPGILVLGNSVMDMVPGELVSIAPTSHTETK